MQPPGIFTLLAMLISMVLAQQGQQVLDAVSGLLGTTICVQLAIQMHASVPSNQQTNAGAHLNAALQLLQSTQAVQQLNSVAQAVPPAQATLQLLQSMQQQLNSAAAPAQQPAPLERQSARKQQHQKRKEQEQEQAAQPRSVKRKLDGDLEQAAKSDVKPMTDEEYEKLKAKRRALLTQLNMTCRGQPPKRENIGAAIADLERRVARQNAAGQGAGPSQPWREPGPSRQPGRGTPYPASYGDDTDSDSDYKP